jgi:hypothetical protein
MAQITFLPHCAFLVMSLWNFLLKWKSLFPNPWVQGLPCDNKMWQRGAVQLWLGQGALHLPLAALEPAQLPLEPAQLTLRRKRGIVAHSSLDWIDPSQSYNPGSPKAHSPIVTLISHRTHRQFWVLYSLPSLLFRSARTLLINKEEGHW